MGYERVSGRAGKVIEGVAEFISVSQSDGTLDQVDDKDFIDSTIGSESAEMLLESYSLSRLGMGGTDSLVIKELSKYNGVGFIPLLRAVNRIAGEVSENK